MNPKLMFTYPTTEELAAMRGPELQALDVQKEILLRAARKALADGITVNVMADGRVIGRFHPDGRSESFPL